MNANNLTVKPLKKVKPDLDLHGWQEFNFNDIFEFIRGRRLVKLDQSEGDIAYISSTKENNGIDNFINPPEYMEIHRNSLTLNNSGSVGYCFYHDYEFVASDHCTVIKSNYSPPKYGVGWVCRRNIWRFVCNTGQLNMYSNEKFDGLFRTLRKIIFFIKDL